MSQFAKKLQRKKSHLLFLWGLYWGDFKRSVVWYLCGRRYLHELINPYLISNHKWCFMVGCNNSGTSILHTLLDRTGVISTTEREGQYYTNVLTRGHRRGYERVWTEFLDEVAMDENSTASVPKMVHDWMTAVQMPMKDIFLDKTTLHAVRMRWLQKAFPNSYFIGVVRNGYSVVEGIKRKGNKSVDRGARHWNLVNKIMMRDCKKINNFLLVKYEDLIRDKEGTAVEIARFLGIEESRLQNVLDTKFQFETLHGDKKSGLRDFDKDSIAKLSSGEIDTITTEAKEMLDYFGYTIERK